jgi:hypothetical protein
LSCKKDKDYPVPEEMKQYFVFQKGSYWIYKNDSTGELDSTYVNYFTSLFDKNGYPGKNREVNQMYFSSKFLSEYLLIYGCLDACGLTVTTIADTSSTETITVGESLTYLDSWQPNTTFSLNTSCAVGIFKYDRIPNVTINNKVYQSIIYSNNTSFDTISYTREFYFAKNIGIIKLFERNKYFKIQRSYSLLRHKVIQ